MTMRGEYKLIHLPDWQSLFPDRKEVARFHVGDYNDYSKEVLRWNALNEGAINARLEIIRDDDSGWFVVKIIHTGM